MIFGTMNHLKIHNKFAFLLLAFFFTVPVYVYAIDKKLELQELLHLFAQQKKSTVDFSEEKHAFFLEQPLKSSGYIEFLAPNKLNKYILKPEKISQKITGNILEVKNSDETHTIDLDDHPEFSVLLKSIISVLAGDLVSLQKDFKVNFTNNSSGWSLLLTPRDSYISGYIESIKMFGNKNNLLKIIVTEANNDHSITLLSNHR